jgi:hypothetical protein
MPVLDLNTNFDTSTVRTDIRLNMHKALSFIVSCLSNFRRLFTKVAFDRAPSVMPHSKSTEALFAVYSQATNFIRSSTNAGFLTRSHSAPSPSFSSQAPGTSGQKLIKRTLCHLEGRLNLFRFRAPSQHLDRHFVIHRRSSPFRSSFVSFVLIRTTFHFARVLTICSTFRDGTSILSMLLDTSRSNSPNKRKIEPDSAANIFRCKRLLIIAFPSFHSL